jgi:hypothetical protein
MLCARSLPRTRSFLPRRPRRCRGRGARFLPPFKQRNQVPPAARTTPIERRYAVVGPDFHVKHATTLRTGGAASRESRTSSNAFSTSGNIRRRRRHQVGSIINEKNTLRRKAATWSVGRRRSGPEASWRNHQSTCTGRRKDRNRSNQDAESNRVASIVKNVKSRHGQS